MTESSCRLRQFHHTSELTPIARWVRFVLFAACLRANTAFAGINEWTYLGLAPEEISSIAVDPTNSDIIYASAFDAFANPNREGGLFKTTDRGVTWDTLGFRHSNVFQVKIDETAPDVIWVANWLNGVFRSTDGGETWEARNNGLTLGGPSSSGVKVIAVSTVYPDILMCGTETDMGPGRGYRTINASETWEELPDFHGSMPDYVDFDRTADHVAYTMQNSPDILRRSIDDGESFTSFPSPVNRGLFDFASSPEHAGELWWATWNDGVWKSIDSGATWQPHITRFHPPDTTGLYPMDWTVSC